MSELTKKKVKQLSASRRMEAVPEYKKIPVMMFPQCLCHGCLNHIPHPANYLLNRGDIEIPCCASVAETLVSDGWKTECFKPIQESRFVMTKKINFRQR